MLKRLNIDKGSVTESSKEGPKLYWEHTDNLKTLLYMMTILKNRSKTTKYRNTLDGNSKVGFCYYITINFQRMLKDLNNGLRQRSKLHCKYSKTLKD